MPSRPAQPTFKQPDLSRRVMDNLPGHARRQDGGDAADGKKLTVGREIQLSGEISACDHLVVEGKVSANLSNASVLEITESGVFVGKVDIAEAKISGVFEGEMTVTRRLTILPTGQVKGTIRYAALVVEEGGRMKGDVAPVTDMDDLA